jgi:Spy/CpxP family protein refolding chaperone
MKAYLLKSLVILLTFLATLPAQAQDDTAGMQEIVAGLQTSLDLSDKQVAQMQTLLVEYRAKMDGILLKYEGQEEPDVAAMIGEMRGARDGYRKDLQGILSKDQYEKYMAKVDSILTDMFNDLAEIKMMEVQPQIDLTDGQVESLAPIVGKSMLSTVRLLIENAGTRLSVPKKVGIGNTMKKIEKEKRAGMEQILTPEQLTAYDKYKEEQKAKKK